MGQRIQPPFVRLEDEAREYIDGCGMPSSTHSGTRQLVGRIAGALGVPPGALYETPTSEAPPSASVAGVMTTDADLDGECAALLDAYRRIRNPETRHRLLILAQGAVEQA